MCRMTHITKGANTPVPAALLRVAVCRRSVPGAPPERSSTPGNVRPGQRGRGNGVVSVGVPIPPGPVIVEAWHEGHGYFGMHTLNRRNKDDDLLYNSTLRDFRGRALVHPPEGIPLRLRVEADNDWTVMVQPLSVARRLDSPLQGFGPEVVAYTGTAADVDVEFAGDEDGGGYFAIKSQELANLRDPDEYDLLVNETDALRQTVPVPAGPLLLLIEADGPWQLTARPLPVLDQAAAQASGVYTGRGKSTVTLVNPAPGRPAILEYAISDEGSFMGYEVKLLDEYDDEEKLLRGGHNGRRGRTLLFREGEPEARLRIEDAGDWSLRLLPVEQAQPLTGSVEGTGSTVLGYTGPPALVGLRRTTDDDNGWLDSWTVQAQGKRAICADTAGRRRPVTGPLWVSEAGYCYLLVQAEDDTGWRLDPAPLDTAPAFGGQGRQVSGHGYGVVRHTGPETEMMLTHEGVAGDRERLRPVGIVGATGQVGTVDAQDPRRAVSEVKGFRPG
jgi:hypothetical protein